MGSTLFQRAFSSGEIAPSYAARADLARYSQALRTCRNFVVQREGGVTRRPGTRYLGAAKRHDNYAFLFPFIYPEADASYLVEAGDGYFRFWHHGAPVIVTSAPAPYNPLTTYVPGDLVTQAGSKYYCHTAALGISPPAGTNWTLLVGGLYEIPHPYQTGRFQGPEPLQWAQAGTVVTLTHLGEPPRELVFQGHTRWVLRPVSTGPSVAPPVGGAAVAFGPSGSGGSQYTYVVTSVGPATFDESLPSAPFSTLTGTARPIATEPTLLTWTPAAGAAAYRVYSDNGAGSGVFGFLGQSLVPAFPDYGQDAALPDFDHQPPTPRVLFASTSNYPATSTVWQQRRLFGRTQFDPETVWASRVASLSNFAVSAPLQNDDAVTFTLASNRFQAIGRLVGLTHLILLTTQGEWIVGGDESGALTPTAINPQQHAYTGASLLTPPVVIGNSLLYVQARGSVLRDLRFDAAVEGYQGRDLTLYAAHLLKGKTIAGLDYAQVPHSIVWALRSDGTLLGLTYIREEDVWGWHRHDTDGEIESVCVIPEGDEDVVYLVVRRITEENNEHRYLERFTTAQWSAQWDAFHVDCGITYARATDAEGEPATTVITGLAHLEAKAVVAYANGVASGPYTVTGGQIAMPKTPAPVVVHIGLPIVSELETLDLDVASAAIRDKKKRVASVSLLLENSVLGFTVGPDADHQYPVRAEAWRSATEMRSDLVEVSTIAQWGSSGRLLLRATGPAPLTVLGILPHVDVGG